ncbi:MAG: NAD-dependent succinate-semialdehyde dehydrogenase [Frankia sp.]|nr:NAD-dependent succinate-semialdehyde dehydrogenase [Frankia sp.]
MAVLTTALDTPLLARAAAGRLLVGGEWREASSGERFAVVDPGNGAVLADVADATVDDGLAAVAAADAAADAWAATAPRERGEVLRRAFDLMTAHRDELARLITLENGKALTEARAEVGYAAEFLRWYSEEAVRADGRATTSPAGGSTILTRMAPVGLSVLVTPWNFPAAMATRKLGPALAAGCATVLKPAAETPLTALALADLLTTAGAPPGVVNVVPTRAAGPVVRAMLADPRARKVSFTGSTQVGQLLLRQAADRVLRVSMELGGNAPFIVLADADLDVAVASALVAKLRNGGQSCVAANRFYVHARVAEEFCARMGAAMARVRTGYGLDDGVEVGAMINERARDKAHGIVVDAVEAGARVVTGGRVIGSSGFFLEPTLLADTPHTARAFREEIFGPVAPVATFTDPDEAVAWANGTDAGLAAFVQSRDLSTALAVADALEAGMVGINRGVVSDPAAPFGGWKHSGLGREGGHEGLLEYLEPKYVAVSW